MLNKKIYQILILVAISSIAISCFPEKKVPIVNNLEVTGGEITDNNKYINSTFYLIKLDEGATAFSITPDAISPTEDVVSVIVEDSQGNSTEYQNNQTIEFSDIQEGVSYYKIYFVTAPYSYLTIIKIVNGNDLLINEVGSVVYSNGSPWLEIYNPTDRDIDLSEYTIESTSNTQLTFSQKLPERVIRAGSHLLIRSKTSSKQVSNDFVLYIGKTEFYPMWYNSGFVKIKKGPVTVDFVKFGSSNAKPDFVSEWEEDVTIEIGSTPNLSEGSSIGRNIESIDTNVASDFQIFAMATPAGQNDITDPTDSDNDGIPDCAEAEAGSTYAGIPLYEYGARVGVKDIFLHIDYMDSDNLGIIPTEEAMQKIRAVFEDYDGEEYKIHIDVGNLFSSTINQSRFNYSGESHRRPYLREIDIDYDSSLTTIHEYKAKFLDPRKVPIVHYVLFADTYKTNVSGVAELYGNDVIISLGPFELTDEVANGKTAEQNRNKRRNIQASTLLHELGHNFGLRHGGDVDTNFMPNYFSTMNYLYQLEGLADPADPNAGDRFYRYSDVYKEKNVPINYLSIVNREVKHQLVYTTSFKIGYSKGLNLAIDETIIDEGKGLGSTDAKPVDYNLNSSYDSSVSYDINYDGAFSLLSDFNDWSLIKLNFANTPQGSITRNISNIKTRDLFNEFQYEIIE
ncbi:MAG: lamin tail domain-containing protein [Spirochaetales bacterium]|nr:lamin tail domain-containing protein [Spirochaetales bacterium]